MPSDSPDDPASSRPARPRPAHSRPARILLVTGLSGAGKTTALRALEDLGWERVDNFPVRLLPRLLHTAPGPSQSGSRLGSPTQAGFTSDAPTQNGAGAEAPLAIGFDARTRGFDPQAVIAEVEAQARDHAIAFTTLYLDCGQQELERRYNETRRRHPLARDRPVADGIAAERELLEPLRRWADVVITTTDFTTHDLARNIRELFAPEQRQAMTVTVSSFGFARGMPPLADLVFDMRFLDNPHWVEALRPLTGRDAPVAAHIEGDPGWAGSFAQIRDLVVGLLPRYAEQDKPYVHVAFGCTGGKHRSVFTAERMAAALREAGYAPGVLHRDLDSGSDDLVEGPRRDEAPAKAKNGR